MSYVYCDACGAGFHSTLLSCPDCGAPARRAHERRTSDSRALAIGEEVEFEVRTARTDGAATRSSEYPAPESEFSQARSHRPPPSAARPPATDEESP